MEAIDLEAFDYSDASSPFYFAYRPFGSCKRKIYLQHHVSGSVYSIFTTCGSNGCPDCGPGYRRNQIGWLAQCFEPYDLIYVALVAVEQWETVKRRLQRHGFDYAWVKDTRPSLLVFATGDFTRGDVRCVAMLQRGALGLLLAKLRRADGLAAKRALDACRAWRRRRGKQEAAQSRKLGVARREVTEAELLQIARELHVARGGQWPEGAERPPDLTPGDFGNLFAEAIDDDWRRHRQS